MQTPLKVAVQKSGRLSEKSISLLTECGIKLSDSKNKLIAPASNFPIELLFLRDDDIPAYVEDGTVDAGIVGENVLMETGCNVTLRKKLGFGKCRLSLAVPKSEKYEGIQYFQNKRIATSYPNILTNFLSQKGVSADIHTISGSVEIAPNIGLADGICDLVSSGGTLFSNGLKETEIILKSEAILVANNNLPIEKQIILDSICFRLDAVFEAKKNKYILMNVPENAIDAVIKVLPGLKSPTVVPLSTSGWYSVHTVITEDKFWEIIDELKKAGAEGILVVPIEKMII